MALRCANGLWFDVRNLQVKREDRHGQNNESRPDLYGDYVEVRKLYRLPRNQDPAPIIPTLLP
jgi:hypothetical protein